MQVRTDYEKKRDVGICGVRTWNLKFFKMMRHEVDRSKQDCAVTVFGCF